MVRRKPAPAEPPVGQAPGTADEGRSKSASGAEAPAKLPKGARRTTPSPETLSRLDPGRLIALILGETARNPAFRKIVSASLAALQGPDAVAAIVDRRLTALEGARSYIDWQKRRAFVADLDATVSVMVNELRPLEPGAALERLVRFLRGADAVLNRVDDGSGSVQAVYDRAVEAAIDLAATLPADTAAGFAASLLPQVAAAPFGPFTGLLRDLLQRLPDTALADLDRALPQALAEAERAPKGKGPNADWTTNLRRTALLRIAQDVAERRGDADAFIRLETQIAPDHPDTLAIAERLLAAGRAAEALDWLRQPAKPGLRIVTRADLIAGAVEPGRPERARVVLEIAALEALGRPAEAQAARWSRFAATLDRDMLRDHLAKLPDFEDDDALARAFATAEAFPDPHRALAFLVGWPDLDRAAALVLARPKAWDGQRYTILAPAAEALAPAHAPAAALLYRCLIDDILRHGRSAAYANGARYLQALDLIAETLPPGSLDPDPDAYRAALRKAHGRKFGFWRYVDVG